MIASNRVTIRLNELVHDKVLNIMPGSKHLPINLSLLLLYMKQWNGSKLGKEYVKAVYCPAYLTSMQSTSCEMLGWRKHKLESRLPEEISITSDMQMTPPLWQKVKKN